MRQEVVFSRIFFGNLGEGLFVKCEDKRYKRGFVCGRIRGIHGFADDVRNGTRTISLDTYFQSYVYKRENTLLKIIEEKEYVKEWIQKRRKYFDER